MFKKFKSKIAKGNSAKGMNMDDSFTVMDTDNIDDFEYLGSDDDFETLEGGQMLDNVPKRKSKFGKKKPAKRKKLSFFKRNKGDAQPKAKIPDENHNIFVDLGLINDDTHGDDFIIVGDKSGRFRGVKTTFKVFFGIVFFIALTVLVYLAMSFKLVPGNVVGTEYKFYNLSAISRNYQPNLDELKSGDTIICVSDEVEWLPLVVEFKAFKFKTNNGPIIFATDENGARQKIQSTDVDYIIKGN